MSEIALRLDQVKRHFPQADGLLEVLRGCSFDIARGEAVALIGPSGSGKSTLLHIAGLLERPDEGVVEIAGREASRLNDAGRTLLRRSSIGFVYQFHHLLPEFSARDNIVLPQMIAGVSKRAAGKRADKLLDLVGLAHRATHRPAELSGGEQQRIAMARALANKPQLLIADEPTGNLDPETAEHVFGVLQELVRTQHIAFLMATHNLDLAQRMTRVLQIKNGHIS